MAITYTEEEHEAMQAEMSRHLGRPEFLKKRHTFEGVVFTNITPPESLRAIREWETREDDVFITSFPKSGTHWMWEIVLLMLAGGDPEKIDRSKIKGTSLEIHFPTEFKIPSHKILAKQESPRIMITHLPWQFLPKQVTEQKKGKIVYLMRNPKDVLASMSRFILAGTEREKDARIWTYLLNCFLTGDGMVAAGTGSWFDHVEGFWKNRNNGNVFFTSYEDMKNDFQSVASPLSKFLLGEELDEESRKAVEVHSTVEGMKRSYKKIEESQPDNVTLTRTVAKISFIQKGVTGSWKEFFTVSENELFDQFSKEKMANCGFKITHT